MSLVPEGFSYAGPRKELHCEGVPLSEVANEVGTPAYVYSKNALLNRVRRFQMALPKHCHIFFAVKACSNTHLLSLISSLGCGADIVSGGELFRASVAGIAPDRIVFSGVGKTRREISEALKAGLRAFNVESVAELALIDEIARQSNMRARVSFRVNPNVNAKTHPHISTGLRKNKFGLAKNELKEAYRSLPSFKAVDPVGLSCHIGSQILSAKPFAQAWSELLRAAREAPFAVRSLDLGGGLGIRYQKERALSIEDYGRLISKTFQGQPYELSVEPGRSLVGPIAVLLAEVAVIKKRDTQLFYVTDAAMNDLLRPALYGATHMAFPVIKSSGRTVKVDLVGPVCESADTFQTSARLPRLRTGALLAFGFAGAYGMAMASQYNSRPRAPEVLVDGTNYKMIRSRETYADIIQHELI